MNERIKELAEQAGFELHYEQDGTFSYSQQFEKFAELIVAECVGKCEFVANMATITNTGEMARKTKATADSCATMIKTHFGVEE
jgi:hypothetical protein